ncbi:helix-turn-helix domain-containing protein [Paractinoplanes aksuensis]|uniref:helix-turn-helix domain-containing protein n=1 Tax=Paractinoplanes aksuensis TaxID=2939490 RepID=UPI0034DB62AD
MASPLNVSPSTPEIYTAAEAAEILRVKRTWLERKAAARRIPFTMLGGSYRFTPEHLQEIVRKFEEFPTVVADSPGRTDTASRRPRRKPAEPSDPSVVPLRPRQPQTHRQNNLAA